MTTIVPVEQIELFIANLVDITPHGDGKSMELPIFAISSKPDLDKYRYENKVTGSWVEIIPSSEGRATIHDKDLLIYAFGQLAEAQQRGLPISRRINITAYDYLKTTGRDINGGAYKAVADSLTRLKGTVIRAYLPDKSEPSSKKSKSQILGLIDYADAVTNANGTLMAFELVISEHLFNEIKENHTLDYNREYFKLRSPYDRRLYELCRRYCPLGGAWRTEVESVWHIYGVKSPLKEFRRKIKECAINNNIPDFQVEYIKAEHRRGPDYLRVTSLLPIE